MNFFTDNEDLKFVFETADLTNIISMFEDNFKDKDLCDYAPNNVEDALENYKRALEVGGDIAARIIAPLSEELDTQESVVKDGNVIYSEPLKEALKALFQSDLMGCTISRKYGGLNLPTFIFTMLVEMIAQADAGIQNIFGLQGVSGIIETFADEALKDKYLPLFTEKNATGAMALTEDEAGSDLQNIKLKAEEGPDGNWKLNGVKRFITNGCGEVLLVLARSEPGTVDGLGLSLFLCEKGDTLRIRRLEEKLGIHSSPTCEMSFNDTPAQLVGDRQRGLVTYVLALLNGARLATAAQSIGIAQAAFNEALAYARVRKQYGRKIEALAPVAEMLVNMKVSIEASRAINYDTAKVADLSMGTIKSKERQDIDPAEKKKLRKDAKKFERLTMLLTSISKYYCSEMCNRVTHDAIQVLGGSGYMKDYPVEKYYRDARITNIYEGTSQLQVLSAFRGILSGTMEKYFEELAEKEYPKPQAALEKKLKKARELLSKSVDRLNRVKDNLIKELYARKAVDMAADILIGYLFLGQSLKSVRKLKIVKSFIREMKPRLKMNAEYIKKTDDSCLKNYRLIVGD